MSDTSGLSQEELRKQAIHRVKAKQNFWRLAGIFAILWVLLIVIWALSAKERTFASFWPIWPIFGMGIALAFTGWGAYGPHEGVTEEQIDTEMRKMQGGS